MNFPTLYHKSKHAAIYSWNISTDGAEIKYDTGQIDGKRVYSSKIAIAKNIGKVNETTPERQAELEAASIYQHKIDTKYSTTPETAQEIQRGVMLAHSFDKHKNKIDFKKGVDFQFKYDGCRCSSQIDENGVVTLSSRGNKEWTEVGFINEELSKILKPGDYLDGELYVAGVGFQTLTSWMKRKQEDTIRIELHCYDFVPAEEDDMPWEERKIKLAELFANNPDLKHTKHVLSRTVYSEDEISAAHDDAVSQGYEGGILRTPEGKYQFGFRSHSLLKVKNFMDDEFLTIAVEPGTGKFSKCAIFTCRTKEGKLFKAVPKATQIEKEEMLTNSHKYIGQMATVNYFGLSDEFIPRFPILKGWRNIKDLPG